MDDYKNTEGILIASAMCSDGPPLRNGTGYELCVDLMKYVATPWTYPSMLYGSGDGAWLQEPDIGRSYEELSSFIRSHLGPPDTTAIV